MCGEDECRVTHPLNRALDKGESSLGGQMCRNIHQLKKTSERIMIVVGSDARKVVMEEFSWWHVKGASIRFNRLEICR